MKYIKSLILGLLSSVALYSADVIITWTDNSQIETGFVVERAPKPVTGTAASSTFVEVGKTAANILTFTDTGLPPSTGYTYRVRAFNDAGVSTPSGVSSVTTSALPLPLAPSGTTTRAVTVPSS